MTRFLRLLIALAVVLSVTGAINLSSRDDPQSGISAAVCLAIFFCALAPALLFLRQQGDPLQNQAVFVETNAVFALLIAPIFFGNYIINFAPEALTHLGVTQGVNLVSVLSVFLLTLYLPAEWRVWVSRTSLLLYCVSIVLDLLTKGILSAVLRNRPSGFLANSNDGGIMMCALLVVSVRWERRSLRDYVWHLIALVGVTISLSRAAIALWFLLFVYFALGFVTRGRMFGRVLTISTIAAGVVVLSTFVADPALLRDAFGDKGQFSRVQRIADLVSGKTGGLAQDPRAIAYAFWLNEVPEHPFLGNGSSYVEASFGPMIDRRPQGPHNMFLARILDSGIIGLGSLLAFIAFWTFFFARRNYPTGVVLVATFAFWCLFSHNVADLRNVLLLFGILAADAASHAPSSAGRRNTFDIRGRYATGRPSA